MAQCGIASLPRGYLTKNNISFEYNIRNSEKRKHYTKLIRYFGFNGVTQENLVWE